MKTSQPFLFKNENNQECLLFCAENTVQNLQVMDFNIEATPWKVWFKNLDTMEEYPLSLPKNLNDVILDTKADLMFDSEETTQSIKDQGRQSEFTIFCNPHLYVDGQTINFCCVAGLLIEGGYNLRYYIVTGQANDLTLKNITDFKAWRRAFSGTKPIGTKIIYSAKTHQIKKNVIRHPESLVIEDLNNGNIEEVNLDTLNINSLYKIAPVFDSDDLTITCSTFFDKHRRSFVLDKDFTTFSEITTPDGNPVYKSSILGKKLIYTKMGTYIEGQPEDRSLEIVEFSEDAKKHFLKNKFNNGKIGGLRKFTKLSFEEVNSQKVLGGAYTDPSEDDSSKEGGPSLLQMAGNFASAMKDFAESGFLRVTKEQHAQRMAICNGCEFWQQGARFGLGKCLKCGCTGAKQWIASSECPIQKWGKVTKEEILLSRTEENAKAEETQGSVSQQADGSTQEPASTQG